MGPKSRALQQKGVEKEGQELEGRGPGLRLVPSSRRDQPEKQARRTVVVGSVMGMVGCCGGREREETGRGRMRGWEVGRKLEASGESGV